MRLVWLEQTRFPVQLDAIVPAAVLGRPLAEVSRIEVPVGNRTVAVGDLFRVEDDGAAETLTFEGDLRHARGVGRGLTSGRLIVRGDLGAHAGARMSGGVLEVHGCAGEWAFAEMAGGMGVVHGDAGHGAGGGYPGSRLGMRGGVVLIHGRVGEEAGVRMRRGLIAITGASGDWLGRGLIAGSILAFGPVGRHPGAGMKRGTLALLATDAPGDFVGYAPTGGYSFPFMTIYLKQLREWGVPVSPSMFAARFQRYNGDLLEGGRGEILTMGG